MPPTPYTRIYPGAAFPALVRPSPCGEMLRQEIVYSGLISQDITKINIGVVPTECTITFADALLPAEEAAFDGICAAHTGIMYVPCLNGMLQAVDLELAITEDVNWQVTSGILTTPTFFTDEEPAQLQYLLGRTIGLHKGDGGQVRVLEKMDGEPDSEMGIINLPDTGGAWAKFKFDTSIPPRPGLRNTYEVQARRNGAVSLSLEFTALSMVKIVVK